MLSKGVFVVNAQKDTIRKDTLDYPLGGKYEPIITNVGDVDVWIDGDKIPAKGSFYSKPFTNAIIRQKKVSIVFDKEQEGKRKVVCDYGTIEGVYFPKVITDPKVLTGEY